MTVVTCADLRGWGNLTRATASTDGGRSARLLSFRLPDPLLSEPVDGEARLRWVNYGIAEVAMGDANVEWVATQLEEFVRLTDGQVRGDLEDVGVWFQAAGSPDEILSQWAVVEQIFDRYLPGWALGDESLSAYESEWKKQRDVAVRVLALVRRQQEIDENLGDGAPMISAGQLHPWVWEGARPLWRSGHFRSAVEDAAKKVNAETQNKVGRRDVSETDLFKQAFTTDNAQTGRSRLRRMTPDASETYKSMQRGAMSLAEGIYAGIRNPFTHESPEDIDEQVALEYLAALSVLARWVDESSLESA